jgi:uncharacterized membrane protein YbhN (UPF0104 family)
MGLPLVGAAKPEGVEVRMIHGTGGMSVLQSSEQFTGRRTVHRKTLRAERTTQIRWRQALQVLAFLLFLAVFLKSFQYLWREIDAQHLELAWQYLHDTTWRQILLACLFVAIAYGAHIVFELLAWTLVRAPMRVRTLSRIALIGAGITNALGQYWLSGSAVRLRLYRLADVPISHMVQVTAFVFSSIWIGYLLVAGFLTAWLPESRITIFNYAFPAEAMALIGLGVPAVYLVWAASKRPLLTQLHPPALSTCLAQITASLIRVFAIASAFYALAPTGAALHYVDVVSAFTGAMLAAAIGQVPGALGVLEGTMVASIGDNAPIAAMLAALIAFRVIFYLIPLGLAAGAFAAWEIRGARASGRATARDASPASSPTDASVHHDDRDTQAQFLGQHALQHAEAVLHAPSAQQGLPGAARRQGVHVRSCAARLPDVRTLWPQLDLPGRSGRAVCCRAGSDQ